jgi:hypothetical protein
VKYEIAAQIPVGDLVVAALWYPAPHNCWRVEIWADDPSGDLQNMEPDVAAQLGEALLSAFDATRNPR